ncbi:MAG: hypothetical protein ACR2LK_14585 [Solirubrobacteraceae bacterium]
MTRPHATHARSALAKAGSQIRRAGTILIAAILLVVPIVLWAQFGDGDLRHAIAVAIIATLLCWCFIHRLDTRHAATAAPQRAAQQPAKARRLDHLRAARMVRPARDSGCPAASLEGRATRRRHPF